MKDTKRRQSRGTVWAAVYRLAAFNIAMGAAAVHAAPLEIQVIQTGEASFERAVAKSKDSAALAASIRQAFPQTIDVIGDFLLGNSTKVAMGEMPIWQE